ncbi:MAG: SoxR reducing system RseC family protein, partial [Deltaproteobacteria bacterium]|nr:SoxR reducing system RseC family protein [Deltaproteobacteria bacterium]
MIEEQGQVIEVKENIATIRAERTSACDSCSSKKSCATVSEEEVLVEAINDIGAKAGDNVIFTVGAGTLLKAGILIYVLPLLMFI